MAPARPQAAPRHNPCLSRPPRRGGGAPPDRASPRRAERAPPPRCRDAFASSDINRGAELPEA
eukprot:59074-Prymnesium_polylepis.1